MAAVQNKLLIDRTVKGVLIPASADMLAHGYSHLLLDDHRGVYLIHHCRKSQRLNMLNRTRVEIHGLMERPTAGEHPRLFVESYKSADTYLNFEPAFAARPTQPLFF